MKVSMHMYGFMYGQRLYLAPYYSGCPSVLRNTKYTITITEMHLRMI